MKSSTTIIVFCILRLPCLGSVLRRTLSQALLVEFPPFPVLAGAHGGLQRNPGFHHLVGRYIHVDGLFPGCRTALVTDLGRGFGLAAGLPARIAEILEIGPTPENDDFPVILQPDAESHAGAA